MKDYILISVNCNEKFWHLSPDEQPGYIKHFQFKTCCILILNCDSLVMERDS